MQRLENKHCDLTFSTLRTLRFHAKTTWEHRIYKRNEQKSAGCGTAKMSMGFLLRSRFNQARNNLAPPEFVLFVNDPQLMTEAYRRYLEARIREAEPYLGLPSILTLRARARDVGRR
jgi:KH-domain-like of EngA bacterial GTPase enzymes, C-terminal